MATSKKTAASTKTVAPKAQGATAAPAKPKKTAAAPKGQKTAAPAVGPKKVGGKKKDGLRGPQVRILEALSKSKTSLSRGDIVTATGLDTAWMTEWVGSSNEEKRLANDAKKFPSLISLGLVKFAETDGKAQTYRITPAGTAALKAAQKTAAK